VEEMPRHQKYGRQWPADQQTAGRLALASVAL